jgi:hypothetical protein
MPLAVWSSHVSPDSQKQLKRIASKVDKEVESGLPIGSYGNQLSAEILTGLMFLTEVIASMEEMEIIFFDELGFGWVVEPHIIEKIRAMSIKQELMLEKTLAELLRHPKSV